jgi:excisionase family DNA binding protein
MATQQQPRYASIADTVRITGLGRSTIYKLLATGDFEARKVGRRCLVDLDRALAWIAAQPRAQVSP